jgi:hypothetical protein
MWILEILPSGGQSLFPHCPKPNACAAKAIQSRRAATQDFYYASRAYNQLRANIRHRTPKILLMLVVRARRGIHLSLTVRERISTFCPPRSTRSSISGQ